MSESDIQAWMKVIKRFSDPRSLAEYIVADVKADLCVMETIAEMRMYDDAQKAYDEGRIEEWLEYHRPKTSEDWEEYYSRVPNPEWKRPHEQH